MSSKPVGAARSPRKRWGIAALVAVALALVLGVGTAWAEATFAKADYRWYTDNPDATEFVVTTGPQMQGLANLVNGSVGEDEGVVVDGPIDFAGKTVRLGTSVNLGNLFGTREFTPIGTDEHPFQGTFDGAGNTVKGMRITSEQGLTKDIGMFGVVGEAGLIRNVNMEDSCLVEIASVEQDNRIEDVGAIVGEMRGSMENCTSAARVNVTYTPEVCTGKVIRNIGGLAGSVQGTVTGCSFSGQLRADTPVNAYEENNESVAYVAENFGGVVGYIYGDLSSSSNSGNLVIVTSGQSGIDRFGSKVEAKAEYIGGVAGYCMSNVDDCHNVADLFATSKEGAKLSDMYGNKSTCDPAVFKSDGGGNGMGGVVGSLRGIAKSGAGDFRTDPGVEGPDAEKRITMSNCTNTGYVSGLHTVGGVVGTAGSYTLVTRCVNGIAGEDPSSDVGHVRTTRWNKPGCGGVVGQSWGNTSYCRNHGTVENTRSGYYSAGIVGMIELHETTAVQKETPEVWACYNTGNVFTDGGALTAFREGAIVGQNNGYVHDNVYLWGTVSTNVSKLTDDNQVAIGGQYGTEANNVAMFNTKAQAEESDGDLITSGQAVAVLNTTAPNNDWIDYYFITSTSNAGYPILNGEGVADSAIDLSKVACQLTFVKNASYTAAYNPLPKLKASIIVDGETVELVQDSDFVVVPDESALDENGVCKGLTNGKQPYRAKIQGIGNYVGQSIQSVSYGIDKGKFSECRVAADSAIYTGQPQNNPVIKVLDAGGAVVDPASYAVEVNKGVDCVKATSIGSKGYLVEATANSTANYEGMAQGYYRIETVDIYRDVDVIGLEYGNRVWYYDEDQCALYEVVPTHADGTPIDQEAGEELEYYKIPAGTDADGNPVYATDADGNEALIPYVQAPNGYNEEDYGLNGNFVTYESKEGRTLTIAEPKHKNENGTPVYNDMTLEFIGEQVRPKVIGALLNGQWLPGTDKLGNTSTAWVALYGATSDGGEMAKPLNVNRTTNNETPQASVVVRGNGSAGYSNLTYMDFRIVPKEASNDNIKVWTKPEYNYYENGGAQPVVPKNRKVFAKAVSEENPAFEVRYAADPESYDPHNPSTYSVLDVANWTLEFDHAEAANGAPINADSTTDFVVGSKSYFKIRSAGEKSSLLGWDEVAAEVPLIVCSASETRISLDDPAIEITVESADYNYDNPAAGLTVVDTANKKTLQPGVDYAIAKPINADGKEDLKAPLAVEKDSATGLYVMKVRLVGQGAYEGSSENIELLYRPGEIDANKLSTKMVDAKGALSGSLTNLPTKPDGWTCDDLSSRIVLTGTVFNHMSAEFAHYSIMGASDLPSLRMRVSVSGFEKGNATTPTPGDVTTVMDGPRGQYYYWLGDVSLADRGLITGVKGDLTAAQRKLRLTNNKSSFLSAITVYGIFSRLELDHEYTYTGSEPDYVIHLYDKDGNDWGKRFCRIKHVEPPVECVNVGDYNVPTVKESAISTTYTYDHRFITGDGEDYNGATVVKSMAIPKAVDAVFDLSFRVIPADIADTDKVRVEVGEAYLAAGATSVEPEVRFYDAQTGGLLNFHEGVGNDYTLEYRNNNHAAPKSDPNPPTVVIRLEGNNLCVNGRSGEGVTYEVPFDILGDGADVADIAWDSASTIALLEGGSLNQPGVVPADASLSYSALGASPDFAIAVGALDDDGNFQEKTEGWQDGDLAYLQIKGIKTGVLTGETVLSRPVQVKENNTALDVVASPTVFTAHAAIPELAVSCKGVVLKEGRDYAWVCDNVNAGEAAVAVRGLGAYAGTGTGAFTIRPASIASEGLEVTTPSKDFTGQTVMLDASDVAKMTVTFNGVSLDAADWTVQNVNEDGTSNVNAGTGVARLVPGASGNFAEGTSREIEFEIEPIALKNEELEITAGSLPYNGGEVIYDDAAAGLAIYDKVRGQSLLYGRDFTVAGYSNNVGVGTATVYLAGAGNYSATKNTVTAEFEITPINFSTAQISIPEPGWYDWQGKGNPVKPVPVVTFGGNVLDPSQYTVSFGSNDAVTELATDGSIVGDAGTLTVTPVEGNKNFTGESVTLSFAIVADLSRATVGVVADQEYDPSGAYAPDLDVHFNGVVLEKDVHYEVVDETGGNAVGSKTLTIRGIGPCAGSRTFTFSVLGKAITDDMVTVDDSGLVYSGQALAPIVTVSDGDYVLEEGKDYVCNYIANIGASSASNHPTVEITGIGNYAFSVAREFNIAPASLGNAKLTLGEAPAFVGNPVTVPVAVHLADGTQLREGTDFAVAYSGNDRAGQASVRVTGIGNYQGTLDGTFVLKGNLAGATIQSIAAVTYNGSAQTPALTVAMGSVTLVAGTDYRVEYSSNVQPGTALVRVVGMGSYEGVTYASFTVKPQPSSVAPDPSQSVVNNYYYYTTNNTTNNGGTTSNTTNNTTNNGGATTNTTTTSGSSTAAPTPQGPTASVASEGVESAPTATYSDEAVTANSDQPTAEELPDDAVPSTDGGAGAGSSEAQGASMGNLFVQSSWFIIVILLGIGLIVFMASLRYRKRNSE